jgi:hypothetical protein
MIERWGMRGFLLSLAVAAVSAWSGVAVAQRAAGPDSCPQASAIVALADYLLVEPEQPARFWRDHEGSDAAFLKLRYGKLSSAEAGGLLNALAARQRPPERIQELGLAHANTTKRAAEIANLPKVESAVPLLRESVLRALIVVDGGDWLFAELVRWRDAAPKSFAETFVFANIARAVADLGDDALASLARRAEAAGLWRLAYELFALRSDFSDLVAFLNRMPEQSLGGGAQTPGEKRKSLLGQALLQASLRSPSPEMTKQPVEVQKLIGERPHLAMMKPFGPLLAQAPDTALLLTILNQTGEKRIATDVAKGLLDDIKSGRLDPVAAPDSVIASMADRLSVVLGAKAAEEELESIRGTGASKVYRNDVAEFVDRALARQALMPFMRGEAKVAPTRPAALSAKFDWDRWLRVANAITAGLPLADNDQLIAADLQGNAGQASEALKSLSLLGPRAEARSIAYDIMRRLDRRCGNLLRPALPLQETLYRFP